MNLDEDEDMDDSSDDTESGDEASAADDDDEMGGRIDTKDQSSDEDSDRVDNEDGDLNQSSKALQALEEHIQNMEYTKPTQKRKASDLDDDSSQPPQQRRRILQEQTQAGTEGEFAAFKHSSEQHKAPSSDLLTMNRE